MGRHSPDRGVSLHHGTILVDTDLKAMGRYLTPDKRKLQAKGIASVGARVINLRERFPELDHNAVCDALAAEFREVEGAKDTPIEDLNSNSPLADEPAFHAFRKEIGDPEWRLGKTPEFSHQLDTRIDGVAVFDVFLQVEAAKITEAVIFSDALYPAVIDKAMLALRGIDYGRNSVHSAL